MKTIRFLYITTAFLLVFVLPVAPVSARLALPNPGQFTLNDVPKFGLHVVDVDAVSVRLRWHPQNGASEYELMRDGQSVGRTIGTVGYFTDFDLRPRVRYHYTVNAYNAQGAMIAQSTSLSVKTSGTVTVRTHYTILALAFNPEQANLATETTYLKHRIQFLQLASLGWANIDLYKGGIISSAVRPATEPGSNWVDYETLVTRKDIPELGGYSMVDLVEKGDIDHVWVVKSPVDFWENILIGNRTIQGQGVTTPDTWVPRAVKSSRSFFVNAYSPDERSYDAYAHMVEGIMTSVSDGHPEMWPLNLPYTVYTTDRSSLDTTQALLNIWQRFRLADGWNGTSHVAYASPGNGNIGSSHFPPTTSRDCADYCYFDIQTWRRYIDSEADNWFNFPKFDSPKRKLNGYDFGAFNNYVEGDPSYSAVFGASPEDHYSFKTAAASFHQWWFAHIPHNPGITNGQLNSWWPHIFDFNRFTGARIDYRVKGFPEMPDHFRQTSHEFGTNEQHNDRDWGYWNSQNGFSPGGKAAQLSMVSKKKSPQYVLTGKYALKVQVENTQYWDSLGYGRNDVFYPMSRNAHWKLPKLAEVQFSIKLGDNPDLIVGTNPIVRLYQNGGNRIELVPLNGGRYTNLFHNSAFRDSQGWYNFRIPLTGSDIWEKNVIGYIDPSLSPSEQQTAKAQLEQNILANLNYIEISIRSSTSRWDAPYDVVSYYIDSLKLISR